MRLIVGKIRSFFFFVCFWCSGADYDVIFFLHALFLFIFLFLHFSGWIVSLAAMNHSVPVGAIMMINAIFFTAQAAMGVVMLKKVKTELFSWHLIGNGHELRLCLQQSVVHKLATACCWPPVSHWFNTTIKQTGYQVVWVVLMLNSAYIVYQRVLLNLSSGPQPVQANWCQLSEGSGRVCHRSHVQSDRAPGGCQRSRQCCPGIFQRTSIEWEAAEGSEGDKWKKKRGLFILN